MTREELQESLGEREADMNRALNRSQARLDTARRRSSRGPSAQDRLSTLSRFRSGRPAVPGTPSNQRATSFSEFLRRQQTQQQRQQGRAERERLGGPPSPAVSEPIQTTMSDRGRLVATLSALGQLEGARAFNLQSQLAEQAEAAGDQERAERLRQGSHQALANAIANVEAGRSAEEGARARELQQRRQQEIQLALAQAAAQGGPDTGAIARMVEPLGAMAVNLRQEGFEDQAASIESLVTQIALQAAGFGGMAGPVPDQDGNEGEDGDAEGEGGGRQSPDEQRARRTASGTNLDTDFDGAEELERRAGSGRER